MVRKYKNKSNITQDSCWSAGTSWIKTCWKVWVAYFFCNEICSYAFQKNNKQKNKIKNLVGRGHAFESVVIKFLSETDVNEEFTFMLNLRFMSAMMLRKRLISTT